MSATSLTELNTLPVGSERKALYLMASSDHDSLPRADAPNHGVVPLNATLAIRTPMRPACPRLRTPRPQDGGDGDMLALM